MLYSVRPDVVLMPVFESIFFLCVKTVFKLMLSFSAICLFIFPRTISFNISVSRRVNKFFLGLLLLFSLDIECYNDPISELFSRSSLGFKMLFRNLLCIIKSLSKLPTEKITA